MLVLTMAVLLPVEIPGAKLWRRERRNIMPQRAKHTLGYVLVKANDRGCPLPRACLVS